MALENVFEDMFSTEDLTAEKILNLLIESDKHLNMKTHILNPLEFSILDIIVIHLRQKKMVKTARMLENFLKADKEYMVSWKRMSRKEIIDALIAMREQKTGASLTQKLLGMKGAENK